MTATASRPLTTTLRLQTFTSFDDAQAVAPEWEALVARLNGSLYMTFDWCQIWWRHYGGGRELRLITVRRSGELVGVLPFFIDRLRLPFGRVRVAKLVGSDSTLDLVEPLVHTGAAAEVFALAIKQLFVDDRADMVHVGPCSGTIPQVDAIRQSATRIDSVARMIRDRESGSHMVFDISEGFDAYMQSLNSHERSNYRRKVKRLDKAFKFDVDVVRDPPLLEREFDAFVDMHQAQWRAAHRLGHFDDWPASCEFSRNLVRTLGRADRVRLIRLLADDQVVTYYWCLRMNGTYYDRFSARLVGEHWDQFGLGRVGLMKMLELAATEGAAAIEAGTGWYEWKEKLNARTLPLHSLTLCRRSLASNLRARLTLAHGDLLNLVYYRVWYIRIAPRVGMLRGPLWRSWIRRRF